MGNPFHKPASRLHRPATLALALLFVFGSMFQTANAAFSPKKMTLSNQNRSNAANNPGTGVQYTLSATGASATAVKRFEFQWQAAQGTDACPTGHVTSSAAFGTTTGLGGLTWTVDNAGSATCLVKFTNVTGNAANGAFTFRIDGITNTTANGTDFVKVTTYDATTAGTQLDQDTVAYVIADSTVQVTATVNETLTFSLATTSVALGVLSTGSVSTGTGNMSVATNAASGYEVNAAGSTLTKGSDTIAFVADGTVTAGSPEYGLAVSTCGGGATCTSGDLGMPQSALISRANTSAGDTHTITYKASINSASAAGAYTSNISYVAVGKF